ncbi:hypothetical protein ABT264_19360 [Streptomyces virginiae]|uniref:hypothetical protein n=1 Tax=Streptomyces virginiae TaxID=1961 RepID=UPI0033187404
MARQFVSDEAGMFRVVVWQLPQVDNPNWQRGVINPDNPRFLYEGIAFMSTYGPYSTVGAARGQLTFRTLDAYGAPRPGVLAGHIQQGSVTWKDVN